MNEPIEMKHLHFTKNPVECIAYDMRNDIFLRFVWWAMWGVTLWFPVAFLVFGAAYGD